jgi:serine/threonine-protein kinase
MSVTDTLINTLFDGRYRILRKLGTGGMANVYLAEDEDLGRRVAIKILNDRYASDEAFTERFRREAKSAAALSHPNIVSIYDRGQADGRPYIAMEVIEGKSLKEVIVGSGPLPISQAVAYAKQILSATRFAHRHGIIHRDIKPHNILLGHEDRLKVTDFGIARSGASQMTEVGSIMGTAQYLSPEQARGAPVTAASDLYSVGIVLYEMLTGKTPFNGETPIEIAMKHVNEPPKAPSEHRPDIPPELDQVVLRALSKDIHERYGSAEEFSADLDRVEAGLPVSPETTAAATAVLTGADATAATQVLRDEAGTRVMPRGTAAPARRPPAYPPDYGYEPARKRRRWVPWLLVLLFAAAAILAGWYVYSRVQDELSETRPIAVPPVLGLPEQQAIDQLESLGFVVDTEDAPSTEVEEGRVSEQDPRAGTELARGETVSLTISTGPPEVEVPSVVGMSFAQARSTLENVGLTARRNNVFSEQPPGTVLRQDPPAGETVIEGSEVRLRVSQGQETALVPDVLQQSQASAEAELAAAGFESSASSEPSDTVPEGLVISQSPNPGEEAPVGSTVAIVISDGPSSVTVPDVRGEDQETAQDALEELGFQVQVEEQETSNPTEEGLVVAQNPGPGVQVAPGSTVTIFVGSLAETATSGARAGPDPPGNAVGLRRRADR